MRATLRSFYLLMLIGAISLTNISDAVDSCKCDGPLLTDKDGKPIWLNTNDLIKGAAHCVAPQMPPLARQAEIDAYVSVDILVDEKGKVVCVRLIKGHPLGASSAIEAAKNWVFRPKTERGKSVSFYGHLRFHFSTGPTAKNENPCTVAHW
jgi:TonB family protein